MAAVIFCILLVFSLGSSVYGQCRGDWHYHGGSCYAVGEAYVTWYQASTLCQAYNGKLAEIESSTENTFLKNMARSHRYQVYWIGGTDVFREGVFTWASTGKSIHHFTDWAPGKPNSNGDQDCMYLWKDDGGTGYQWDDLDCKENHLFICEKSSEDTSAG